jgi:hypothetical protein
LRPEGWHCKPRVSCYSVLHMSDLLQEVGISQQPEAKKLDEHLAMLGRLASTLSHEIRNLLSAVFLHVDILEEELQQPTADSCACIAENPDGDQDRARPYWRSGAGLPVTGAPDRPAPRARRARRRGTSICPGDARAVKEPWHCASPTGSCRPGAGGPASQCLSPCAAQPGT